MNKKILFLISALLLSNIIFGQEALKSVEEEYYDFLSLQGLVERPTLGYRTLSDSVWEPEEDVDHIWQGNNLGKTNILWEADNKSENWFSNGIFHGVKYKLYGPEWFNSYNTDVPYGQNDGALWQGVGYNTSLTGGVRFEGFGFEATFKPQLTWSQNKEFEYLPGVYGDPHSYFWAGNIDLVQRFGDTSYWQFDFGDSELRYSFYNFTVGFGTQSPWIGPAQLNPMLGSNNAGAYPKFDFGLRKTDVIIPGLGWNLGKIESRIWIGQLTESDYFNNDGIKDINLIDGFNISFSPSFFPEMTVGATKICLTRWGNNFWKYINPFYDENDITGIGEDQKASVYFDFLFPLHQFEIYLEIGVDDYNYNRYTNILHTIIYSLGCKKNFNLFENLGIELFCEINIFEMSQDFQLQWNYMGYFSHGQISEGYTQNGQIIGAGSGFFGNSQIYGVKISHNKGYTNLYLHRNSPEVNYIYNFAVNDTAVNSNVHYATAQTFYNIGIDNSIFITKDMICSLNFVYSIIHCKFFQDVRSLEKNINFSCSLKYNF